LYLQVELLLIIFTLSGITLKISDFLGEKGKTPASFVTATLSALIFGLLMSESTFSSSLILGLFTGLILSKKVDKLNLFFGLFLALITAFYFDLMLPDLWLLVLVAIFTFIDEIAHEKLTQKKGLPALIFQYRPLLKLIIIFLAIISLITLIHLISFLCFDLSYDLTTSVLEREKR
jgi:hypothetical protein